MIKLLDKVRIKKTGVVGTVLDIRTVKSDVRYTIESEKEGEAVRTGGYSGRYPQYDCLEEEIELA